MEAFMEADLLRRQAVTILQLTVVTLFSLVGTITTGFLGMNLFNHADLPTMDRLVIFFLVFIPTSLLTLYTVRKSRRLAHFLDTLASDKASLRTKWSAFLAVWDSRRDVSVD
jgi:cell division protein FtsL